MSFAQNNTESTAPIDSSVILSNHVQEMSVFVTG